MRLLIRNARPRLVLSALSVLALVTALAGCGTSGTADSAAGSTTTTGYQPVTVTDCNGRKANFTAPPHRVVALTTSVLEMLFWLGVGDKVVGIGTPPAPGTMPAQFDAAIQQLPKLAGPYKPGSFKPVPHEQLLAANPDFVVGGFSSNFSAAGATSQQELTSLGVPSYLALSTSCASALTKPLTGFDLVYQDLRNLGAVFGVSDKANSLIAQMQGKVTQVGQAVGGDSVPTVFPFEYDEGTQTPYAPGNRQAVNATITQAGGKNIFAAINTAYQKVSWEQIAQDNPDVILLIIYDKGNAAANQADFAAAKKFVLGFPVLANTTAVKQGRFAELLYEQGSNGGVRNADAVVDLARQLHPGKVS